MYTELLLPLSRVFLMDSCDEYIPLCRLQISALSPLGMETKLKVSSTDSLLRCVGLISSLSHRRLDTNIARFVSGQSSTQNSRG